MAIPKTVTRAILLVGKEHSQVKELVAGGTITPGHLLQINSAGKYVVHAAAAGRALSVFADMCDYNGKGIDDNYVANDNVFAWVVGRGGEVNALVKAAAVAIAAGDYLESAGDGTLRKATPGSQDGTTPFAAIFPGNAVAQALEAVDNSAGGTPARIRVIIL